MLTGETKPCGFTASIEDPGGVQDVFRGVADNQTGDAGSAYGAHHDQVGVDPSDRAVMAFEAFSFTSLTWGLALDRP